MILQVHGQRAEIMTIISGNNDSNNAVLSTVDPIFLDIIYRSKQLIQKM